MASEIGSDLVRFRATCCRKFLRFQPLACASRNYPGETFALRSRVAVQAVQGARPSIGSAAQQTPQAQQGPDISRLHPLLQRQWDHPKNSHLGSVVITPGSHKVAWWRCDECPAGHHHEWSAMVNNRTQQAKVARSNGCPHCTGQAVCPHNSLAMNDLVVAAQWSDKNTDRPEDYTIASNAKKLWHCDCCGRDWAAAISDRTLRENGCPHCFDLTRKVKKQRQPPVAESQHAMMYWDWQENKKAGLDPHKLRQGSNKHAYWVCSACPKGQPHRWTATVLSVCNKESGCPCCRGRKACICNSLQSLYPDIAAEWDYSRNTGTPADYSAQSNRNAWWWVAQKGSFEAMIKLRSQTAKRKAQP